MKNKSYNTYCTYGGLEKLVYIKNNKTVDWWFILFAIWTTFQSAALLLQALFYGQSMSVKQINEYFCVQASASASTLEVSSVVLLLNEIIFGGLWGERWHILSEQCSA